MSYLITFLTGILIGFIGGVLVVRNNLGKAKQLDDKGKALLDALKSPDNK